VDRVWSKPRRQWAPPNKRFNEQSNGCISKPLRARTISRTANFSCFHLELNAEVLEPYVSWINSILQGILLGVAIVIVKIPIFASRMLEGRYTCLATGVCHPKWLLCALLMFYPKTSQPQMSVACKNRKKITLNCSSLPRFFLIKRLSCRAFR